MGQPTGRAGAAWQQRQTMSNQGYYGNSYSSLNAPAKPQGAYRIPRDKMRKMSRDELVSIASLGASGDPIDEINSKIAMLELEKRK